MRLHTKTQGSITGYPVLCLHGHPGSGAAMSVFTDTLAALGFRTYAPDLRGYGHSKTAYPFEMIRHLDDLEELLARYGIKECLVLGWSLGGILAMELALRRSDVVQGLVLIGTAARPRGSHPPISLQDNVMTGIAGLVNWVVPGWKGAIALGKQSLFRYLICNHTPTAYSYLAKAGAPATLRTSRHATTALNQSIRAGYNRLPDIKALQIPVLMLCGECDRHITAKSSLETAQALPNCESHCYPNTAHLFPWEIPDQVNSDIQNWLGRHKERFN
ncbi:alpha/beta hydrolase [cf. Phormidesmis sp. LEGE 11477]|uniref:alpha/beta hydrolase n=1 Tax=cf. Phormidesmis sp. LEGE 11477 TaxID=1828680 RepID=UPI00188201F4|nr:alpha/beta hydrolase [cf. Phormidesmis sp. LEGE 11477]MBE9061178.1 alpha/beta hydrolase [cf. Phormidesmis sp. LEGE 11477]